jgi:hypothetical protein
VQQNCHCVGTCGAGVDAGLPLTFYKIRSHGHGVSAIIAQHKAREKVVCMSCKLSITLAMSIALFPSPSLHVLIPSPSSPI